ATRSVWLVRVDVVVTSDPTVAVPAWAPVTELSDAPVVVVSVPDQVASRTSPWFVVRSVPERVLVVVPEVAAVPVIEVPLDAVVVVPLTVLDVVWVRVWLAAVVSVRAVVVPDSSDVKAPVTEFPWLVPDREAVFVAVLVTVSVWLTLVESRVLPVVETVS